MVSERKAWIIFPAFPHVEVEGVLALGSLTLFAFATTAVMFAEVPEKNEKYAMLMLGALIGIVKDCFGRYFTATKGAQEQRKEAAEVARTLASKVPDQT